MRNKILFIYILFVSVTTNAQTIERVEVNGRIIVETNDVEGVTIYNTSSNKGTITNSKGEFRIQVTLNDILEISALQFEIFTVKIDEKILDNKYFTVYLVERINKLDEVIITPYDMLTGNMVMDIKSVETFNPNLDAIYFGVNEIYAYEFTDDYKSRVDNTLLKKGELYNGVDVFGILSRVLRPVFKDENEEQKITKNIFPSVNLKKKDLSDIYGREFLSNTFNISEDKVESFVAYVNSNNFDYNLLVSGNEIRLIEHLYTQSLEFLKAENDKN